jgi:hypothetical protein
VSSLPNTFEEFEASLASGLGMTLTTWRGLASIHATLKPRRSAPPAPETASNVRFTKHGAKITTVHNRASEPSGPANSTRKLPSGNVCSTFIFSNTSAREPKQPESRATGRSVRTRYI